ncbi:MAG: hypothetical protein LC790_17945, partial [Actinobacteria bacterium]|nr:hypothetical protein [Actinomycetota bacterium]
MEADLQLIASAALGDDLHWAWPEQGYEPFGEGFERRGLVGVRWRVWCAGLGITAVNLALEFAYGPPGVRTAASQVDPVAVIGQA